VSHIDIHHILHYDIKEKKNLFLSSGIRLFWASLVGVFVPAILYLNMGMSLAHFFWFFVISSTTTIVLDLFVTRRLINQQGTKVGMLVGLPFLVLYFYGIMLISQHSSWYRVAALALGVFTAFFWTSFHVDIAQSSKQKKFGTKIAKLHIIFTVTGAVAPLLWWLVMDHFGKAPSFLLSLIFVLASGIPLLFSFKRHKSVKAYDTFSLFHFLRKNIFSPMTISFASKGYTAMIWWLYWPLFLYITLKNFTKVGAVAMAATLVVAVLLYFAGKQSDKHHEKKVVNISSVFQGFNWISACVVFFLGAFSWVTVTLIDIFHNFTFKINDMCITTTLYQKANDPQKTILTILLHEIAIHGFRIIYMSIFALLFTFIPISPSMMFLPFLILLAMIPFQWRIYKNVRCRV